MGPSGAQLLFPETMIFDFGPAWRSLRQNLSRTVQGGEMGPAGTQAAFIETRFWVPDLDLRNCDWTWRRIVCGKASFG